MIDNSFEINDVVRLIIGVEVFPKESLGIVVYVNHSTFDMHVKFTTEVAGEFYESIIRTTTMNPIVEKVML